MDSHLHLLKATSRLMHYDLPIYSLDSTFCTALLAHASFLQTVHIYCGSMSETHFHNASRILASCRNLASFLFRLTDSPRGQSTWQDGILALFDKPWNCPNLKEFELHGFKPDPRQPVGQRISAMYMELLSLRGSGNAHHGGSTMRLRPRINNNTQAVAGGGRSQSGTDHIPPANTHAGQPVSRISDWIERVARRKSNTNVSEMMANEGWTTKQGAANWSRRGVDNMELSKIEQIVQDMVFSRVIIFPHMCKLTLEEFVLIKKGRAA
ncbi:hypothetical protein BGZ74_001001 [Mortierella antarctica]|nr:hypothetical protein BGZ74_001001 [Mortierella antarctica]